MSENAYEIYKCYKELYKTDQNELTYDSMIKYLIKATEFSLRDNRLAYLTYLCEEYKDAGNEEGLISVLRTY